MNTIFRNTRVLPKKLYENRLIVQKANFMAGNDIRRFGLLGKHKDYSSDYSYPLIVRLGPIIGIIGLIILGAEGGFGWKKRQFTEKDKQKKKQKWLFVYDKLDPSNPYKEYPFEGLEESRSSRNNQNFWTNPKNIRKYEESDAVHRIYLKKT